MSKFFITGTGTDIGKTFVTTALIHQFRAQHKVEVFKPIVTGWSENCDTHLLLAANQQELTEQNIDRCSPWRFDAPLSPDMAASLEKREINFDELEKFCRDLGGDENVTFIEGAGGVMTPVNSMKTFRDLILELQLPTILVTGTYLGSISHTLTALESLQRLKNVTIIINQSENSEVSLEKTASTISNFTKHKIIKLPRSETWQETPEIDLFKT